MDTDDIDTVLLAGATGGTGREVLRLIGSRVDTVRALTRSVDAAPDLRAAGADEVVVDDLLNPDGLAAVVDGADAVISAVGSTLSAVRDGPPFVDGAGNRALLTAAVGAGVDAFVMESAIGVGPEPASPLAKAFDGVIGPLQAAKGEAEAAIRDAAVRHTIFRPGGPDERPADRPGHDGRTGSEAVGDRLAGGRGEGHGRGADHGGRREPDVRGRLDAAVPRPRSRRELDPPALRG